MFGLTMDKLVVILVIGVFLLGPKRLPVAAASLARIVKTLRGMADQAQGRLKEELGPEFAEVDWASLDPRKYDPRRIIADALMEPTTPPEAVAATTPSEPPVVDNVRRSTDPAPPPAVDEAA